MAGILKLIDTDTKLDLLKSILGYDIEDQKQFTKLDMSKVYHQGYENSGHCTAFTSAWSFYK